MKLKPTQGHVVIERDPNQEKTPGGIFLPAKAQEKQKKGTVLAVNAKDTDLDFKVGDDVVFISGMLGNEIEVDGTKLLLVPVKDVLATVV